MKADVTIISLSLSQKTGRLTGKNIKSMYVDHVAFTCAYTLLYQASSSPHPNTQTLGVGPPSTWLPAEQNREHKHGNDCVHPHPQTSCMRLKTHKCSHTVHMYSTCRHTKKLARHKHARSRWH